MNVPDSNEPALTVNSTFERFTLPYKEICWQKFLLYGSSPLHVYSGVIDKESLKL